MRGQRVCSREWEIVLYKRSSIKKLLCCILYIYLAVIHCMYIYIYIYYIIKWLHQVGVWSLVYMETVSLSSLVAAIKMSVEGFVVGFGSRAISVGFFFNWTVACWKLLPVLGGFPTGVLAEFQSRLNPQGSWLPFERCHTNTTHKKDLSCQR